ncbi:MAG TPA: hydrogenase maturation nickel metallochaperone HypA [Kofleriaceae bacterium]|jgi:hydrogenase nickel incorporation protein HypA/HybF
MHELGIAMEIAELAAARAGDQQVHRIVIEVGAFTAVLPDALAFAWEAATEDSALAGSTLEIVTVAGRGACRRCGAEQAMPAIFTRCACGGTDLAVLAGEELRIRELEVSARCA